MIREIFPPHERVPAAGTFEESGGLFLISRPRFSSTGIHAVLPAESLGRCVSKLAELSSELSGDALTIARVSQRISSFPEELNPELLLSESGRLDLVSFTKGCYVGQEVVAKIDAVGRAPRALVTYCSSSNAGPAAGQSIEDAALSPGRAVGKILSAVSDPVEKKTVGFAVLRSDRVANPAGLSAGQFDFASVLPALACGSGT